MASIDTTHLLTQTSALLQSQRARRESTGEGFNFFTALSSHHDENRHSRFLRSLLNPCGAHGQGALFLRRFLIELGLVEEAQAPAWRWDQWRVEIEVTFRDSGRRIDLLLQGPEAIVGIENKVLSGEGKAQLRSYADSLAALRRTRPAVLVFLTPTGRESESDAGTKAVHAAGVQLICCGYGGQASPSLVAWLAACQEAVAGKVRLTEVIQQYADLADRIGGNTMGTQDRQALAAWLQQRAHFEAATALVEALAEAKIHAQVAFWEALTLPLPIWPEVGRAAPDTALVRRYYGAGRGRPAVGRVHDIGLRWRGHALVLVLELLPDKDRPYLTWKFQLRSEAVPDQAMPFPKDDALSDALCKLMPSNLKPSRASLATGDLVLPDGSPLDLTDFKRGRAPELLGLDTRGPMLNEVAQAVADLVQRAADVLAMHRSQ